MATKNEVNDCIKLISNLAIENYKKSRVLPSLVIAQACWESGYLTSELAKNGYNPFGIKFNKDICNNYYTYKNSKWCKFDSFEQAVIKQGEFYNLYSRYSGIVGEKNIDKVLKALESSGYCEGDGYSSNIKRMIDTYNLLDFDVKIAHDEIDVRTDKTYHQSLKYFTDKGIISQSSWNDVISNKYTEALVMKTCEYLYKTKSYKDGINKLRNNGIISSDIWDNVDEVKAIHLRSFIIKVSKYL